VRSVVEVGGESLDHLKKSLNNWFAEEEQRLIHTSNDNKKNFDPSQVKNPIEKRRKGRSPVKQFKNSTESLQIKRKKSGKTTQNKCSKCEIVGHYASTCKKLVG
ncbi:9525_t:CDS:1, partial [Ambispora gerdemannii]